MSTHTDRRALEQARQDAAAEVVQQLRAFTGILGFTPSLTEPEHRAYPAYAQHLEHGLEMWINRRNIWQANADRFTDELSEANRILADEQRRRAGLRPDHVGGKLLGAIQDISFPEKRAQQSAQRAVDEAWAYRHEAEDRVAEISSELSRVRDWIHSLFADVDAVRAGRV